MSAPKRNLVVVRAGDNSLHPAWLIPEAQRTWDLVVSYYGKNPDIYRTPGVQRFDQPGPKWQGLATFFASGGFDLSPYRSIWIPDDDLDISGESINQFFAIFEHLNLEVAQPALRWDSYYSHPITLRHPNFKYRFTNFVEGMAPCFRADTFQRMRETFGLTVSGWGIDILWQRYLTRPVGMSAIIDLVDMRHTRPVGGPNYQHVKQSGVSAPEEMNALLERFGIRDYSPMVFAGELMNNELATLEQSRSPLVMACLDGIAPRLVGEPEQFARYTGQLLASRWPGSTVQPAPKPAHAAAAELAAHVNHTVFGRNAFGYDTEPLTHLVAAFEAAQYRNAHLRSVPCHGSGMELLLAALAQAPSEGLILEFGVATGQTIRAIASQTHASVHGFDSFEGLPETWRPGFQKGEFRQAGLPEVPGHVTLIKGLFSDTLPKFLEAHHGPVAFLHIDCDLYESTRYVLAQLADRIVPGTVIVFDEYINFPGWQKDEYRAFREFTETTGKCYRYLGQVPSHQQVAVVIE